jgi:glycosyltransferase involved in cell wall biosynthesis
MSQVKFHTVDQPESDTTTFVLSCNRLDVLAKTLQSFFDTQDYVTKMVIVDDSAEEGVFEKLVEEYGDIADVICFPRNRSQWWAMDFMVSYCDSEYIFYLEDDWEFTRPGYLNQSKQILQKYREVGVVDTSWRTFEFQGIDSYEKGLVDGMFYWKKPWKITDGHVAWHCWVGSPNLRRRDDLIMLGRVEKWHNEWNIDRKFTALGFRGVYLNGEYSRHLGDKCSKMEGKRPDDTKIPYDFYPKEVLANRRAPYINYREMDWIYEYPADVTLVTMAVDISRGDRSFEEHYIKGLDYLLAVRNPLVVYADPKYHGYIRNRRKELSIATSNNRIELRGLTLEDLQARTPFAKIQEVISSDRWIDQSSWIRGSALTNPYYIPLTLIKNSLLAQVANSNPMGSKRFYWIDSGMSNSFGVTEPIKTWNFLFLPKDKFFLSSYPYQTNSEIHGCNIDVMTEIVGAKPEYVCRATLFGGSLDQISEFNDKYFQLINQCLDKGTIGTEEAIFTMVEMMNPDLVNRYEMPNGDIKNYLNTIRNR